MLHIHSRGPAGPAHAWTPCFEQTAIWTSYNAHYRGLPLLSGTLWHIVLDVQGLQTTRAITRALPPGLMHAAGQAVLCILPPVCTESEASV